MLYIAPLHSDATPPSPSRYVTIAERVALMSSQSDAQPPGVMLDAGDDVGDESSDVSISSVSMFSELSSGEEAEWSM